MTDEELELLIREVEAKRPQQALPELDEPLGTDFAASIVQRYSDEPAQQDPTTPRPANRPWIAVVAAVLVAAGLLAMLLVPSGTDPLPTYALTARTGISEVRSEANGPLIAAPGAPVRLVLRPATRTDQVPQVQASVGGKSVQLSVKPQPGGALEVTLGALPTGRNTVQVELRVGEQVLQQFAVDVEASP